MEYANYEHHTRRHGPDRSRNYSLRMIIGRKIRLTLRT